MRLLLLISSLCIATCAELAAQTRTARPFEIADNSFLVEEAFNQEAGIFQNIFVLRRAHGGGWGVEFTQEWPMGTQTHQFSYTVPFADEKVGNVALNYRWQARLEDDAGPAFSPRLSAVLPTGPDDAYKWGAQLNLPVSRQVGDFYLHANAGASYDKVELPTDETESLVSPHAAASVIYRLRPMLHLMTETVVRSEQALDGAGGKERETSFVLSPGARFGWNLGSHQLILGAAVPIEMTAKGEGSLLFYLSYELPFK